MSRDRDVKLAGDSSNCRAISSSVEARGHGVRTWEFKGAIPTSGEYYPAPLEQSALSDRSDSRLGIVRIARSPQSFALAKQASAFNV